MRSTESRVRSMRAPRRLAIALLGAAALCAGVPAFGANVPNVGTNSTQPTAPGTLNYIQGTVLLDGNQMEQANVGNTELASGQMLRTGTGKAEVRLNPGVYLRLNDHTEAKMLSMAITPTRIEVKRGEIGIEVDEIHPQNVLQVTDHGVTTQLVKKGYYEFNANNPRVKVFSGQAEVHIRKNAWKRVGGLQEMALAHANHAKIRKFQANPAEDSLMAWSKLRSQYLAEANQENSPEYWGGGWGGPGWGPGWGWGGLGFGWGWGW